MKAILLTICLLAAAAARGDLALSKEREEQLRENAREMLSEVEKLEREAETLFDGQWKTIDSLFREHLPNIISDYLSAIDEDESIIYIKKRLKEAASKGSDVSTCETFLNDRLKILIDNINYTMTQNLRGYNESWTRTSELIRKDVDEIKRSLEADKLEEELKLCGRSEDCNLTKIRGNVDYFARFIDEWKKWNLSATNGMEYLWQAIETASRQLEGLVVRPVSECLILNL